MDIHEAIKQKRFSTLVEQSIVNILYTSSWINTLHAEVLKKYKISLQQYNILRILKGHHPEVASIHMLADRMLDKNSNASRLVEKLRAKGFITRKTCPEDRRRAEISITPLGLETLQMCNAEIFALQENQDRLSADEHEELNQLLNKFRS